MYNFVALIWDPTDRAAGTTARHLGARLHDRRSDLTKLVSTDGLVTYAASPKGNALRAYTLPGSRGVVLGRLFRQGSNFQDPPADTAIDEATAQRIVRSGGEYLVNEYWGAYIALLSDSNGTRSCVIRDCSGWIPCYRTSHANVHVIFSDLQDIAALRLPPFTLNKRYLAASIYYPSLHVNDCGFSEVTELLAGECLEVHEASVRQYSIWKPHSVALRRIVEDYDTAEAALRTTTQKCIDAWAGAHADSSILLNLSGGLDSAIVLGCLKRAPKRPTITCLNQCTENTADDERRYARLAAGRAAVPLIESPWSDVAFSDRLAALPKSPKSYPGDIYRWLECDLHNHIASRAGAEAIWTGQGGDHLFWAFSRYPVAADYVTRHGFDTGLLGVVADAARLSRKSYLTVIREAVTLGRPSVPWTTAEEHQAKGHFVIPENLPADCDAYVRHPWVSACTALPRVKQAQVALLAELLNRHNHIPRGEYAYQRHPLLAQPLMELSLQIPSYVLVRGGRRRALARSAFRDSVPKEILEREDKGETSARVRAMIRQNEPFLRDLLLNGLLVQEGIVSRRALEVILVEGQPYRPQTDWALLGCIATEIWARSPTETSARRAA